MSFTGSGGSGSVTTGPWQAKYYSNTTLTGTPALTRTDASISFNWAGASPGTGIPTSGWSASWTGSFTPLVTGSYTFSASETGGGFRIIVNGATVVDNWSGSGGTSGAVALNAGSLVNVTVQYYDNPTVAAGWGSNLLLGFYYLIDHSGTYTASYTKYVSTNPVTVVGGQPFRFSTHVTPGDTAVQVSATITWYSASGVRSEHRSQLSKIRGIHTT